MKGCVHRGPNGSWLPSSLLTQPPAKDGGQRVSFTEAALPLGGCDWGRAGSRELLTFLGLYGVGEAVGFGSPCRLGGLVPRPQFCLALLCSR